MAQSGVQFLQANLEDAPKTLGGYKPGNTDLIRTMLREQQKDCRALHGNPLFKEFRGHGDKQRRGKGYGMDAAVPPQFSDDPAAEGKARMFDVIRQTAVKEDKAPVGVWASFGKPYMCLGEPKEVRGGVGV